MSYRRIKGPLDYPESREDEIRLYGVLKSDGADMSAGWCGGCGARLGASAIHTPDCSWAPLIARDYPDAR